MPLSTLDALLDKHVASWHCFGNFLIPIYDCAGRKAKKNQGDALQDVVQKFIRHAIFPKLLKYQLPSLTEKLQSQSTVDNV